MEQYISVYKLVDYLIKKNDNDQVLKNVHISGEISNVKLYPNNNIYFNLKDKKAKINCIVFSKTSISLKFKPKNGDKVNVTGRVKIYQNNSTFQLIIQNINLNGYGDLFIRYEESKKKLEKEGYFDIKNKKEMKLFYQKIAIISGPDSAALKDVLITINTRYKLSQIVVFPCVVQGDNAANKITEMLRLIDKYSFDIILLVRGGGSFEDLNAFNNENLVKTIYNLNTTIITGVGHETDITLVDFVSDYRAATPTAAATKISPDSRELNKYLINLQKNLNYKFNIIINSKMNIIKNYSNNEVFSSYLHKINNKSQYIDYLYSMVNKLLNYKIESRRTKLQNLSLEIERNNVKYKINETYLRNFENFNIINSIFTYNISLKKSYIDLLFDKLNNIYNIRYSHTKININEMIIKLNLLDPKIILDKGYAIVLKNNLIVKNFGEFNIDDNIVILNNKNKIIATINEVNLIEQNEL